MFSTPLSSSCRSSISSLENTFSYWSKKNSLIIGGILAWILSLSGSLVNISGLSKRWIPFDLLTLCLASLKDCEAWLLWPLLNSNPSFSSSPFSVLLPNTIPWEIWFTFDSCLLENLVDYWYCKYSLSFIWLFWSLRSFIRCLKSYSFGPKIKK